MKLPPYLFWLVAGGAWLLLAYDQPPLAIAGSLLAAYLIRRVWVHRHTTVLWQPWFFIIALAALFLMAAANELFFPAKKPSVAVAACVSDYLPQGGSGDGKGIFASAASARKPLQEACDQVDQRGGLTGKGYVEQSFALAFCEKLAARDYDLRRAQGQSLRQGKQAYVQLLGSRCRRAIRR